MVVRDITDISKNRQRSLSLDQFLKQHNIPGISGIDTRHLIRQINQTGTIKAVSWTLRRPRLRSVARHGVNEPASGASCYAAAIPKPESGYNVVVIDFGLKHGILRQLSKRDCNVTVLPWNASAQDIINLDPDGVLLSTGPGSPLDLPESVLDMIRTIQERIPLFAIGLGHELFALANGSEITKLKLSHHGANHPIRKIITNEIIYAMESEEYVVDPDSVDRDRLITTYLDLIDGSIQGLRHRDYPAFSVQFFPDGAPGPDDSVDLFDEFVEIMGTRE